MTADSAVSVIVVNWNGRDLLDECLNSIIAQTFRPREIVVVDNGSSDDSVGYLEREWSQRVRLVRHPANLGFAGGVNSGIRASSGEWIALLNTDAVADPGWLAAMLEAVRGDAGVGMCACKILLADPAGHIDKAGHLLYWDGLNGGRGFGEPDCGQFDRIEESLFPDGCAAMYRKELFDQVGLFDEQFFAYGDDAELGLRGRLHGWRCVYTPFAVVQHRHSTSLGAASPQKAFLVERNRIWLAFKLFPPALLLMNPFFAFWRYVWHGLSALGLGGSARTFIRRNSTWKLCWVLVLANASALRGLPAILQKRRQVARQKTLRSVEFLNLIRNFRISAKELALRDR
jgi:GT2 family glycosyltransferase